MEKKTAPEGEEIKELSFVRRDDGAIAEVLLKTASRRYRVFPSIGDDGEWQLKLTEDKTGEQA